MDTEQQLKEREELIQKLAVKDPDSMITTTSGLKKVGDLERRVTAIENDNELTYIIEYFDSPPIHRSVHVQLKKGVEASAVAASL